MHLNAHHRLHKSVRERAVRITHRPTYCTSRDVHTCQHLWERTDRDKNDQHERTALCVFAKSGKPSGENVSSSVRSRTHLWSQDWGSYWAYTTLNLNLNMSPIRVVLRSRKSQPKHRTRSGRYKCAFIRRRQHITAPLPHTHQRPQGLSRKIVIWTWRDAMFSVSSSPNIQTQKNL